MDQILTCRFVAENSVVGGVDLEVFSADKK